MKKYVLINQPGFLNDGAPGETARHYVIFTNIKPYKPYKYEFEHTTFKPDFKGTVVCDWFKIIPHNRIVTNSVNNFNGITLIFSSSHVIKTSDDIQPLVKEYLTYLL